jgi:predicted RecA/RadA family phage recombinase
MKNFVQPGTTVTVIAPGAVSSGDLVVVGRLIGVAAYSAAIATEVEIDTEGVFDLPKVLTDVIAAGNLLYWRSDVSQLTVTPGTGSRPIVGIAVAAAGNGVSAVRCRLTLTGATGPA